MGHGTTRLQDCNIGSFFARIERLGLFLNELNDYIYLHEWHETTI